MDTVSFPSLSIKQRQHDAHYAAGHLFKSSSMQGGSGDDSYSNNSRLQNYHFHTHAKSYLADAIHHCDIFGQADAASFRVADFGCCHGRNTTECADFVVEQILERHGVRDTEVQYFFSDLPSNDFNSLFQLLKHSNPETADQKSGQLYVAGVPGSFHNQLFPIASLDLAICMNALHWLSEVPPTVLDKTSPAWNGGHVWVHGERPNVAQAYAQQIQADIKSFLRCRALELAKGGVLFICTSTRQAEHPTGDYTEGNSDSWSGYFESTWNEMVSEGLLRAEERDTFNVPQYNFHRAELEEALKDVSGLELIKLDVLKDRSNLPPKEVQQILNDPQSLATFYVGFAKALIKPMVQKHIGEQRTAELFKRMHRNIALNPTRFKNLNYDVLIATLRRR